MKKGFLIAALILIGTGIIVLGVAFMASGFDLSQLDTARYETNTYTLDDDFDLIKIESDMANVTLKPSEDGTIKVDCFERVKIKHAVSVEKGVLTIVAVDKREWYDYLAFFSFRAPSVTVYLPSGHYRDLWISTKTGDVSIPASFSFGEAVITAGTGAVTFDAACKGNLNIETSTGDIRINGVHATMLNLSVSTGKIEVKNAECEKTLAIGVSTGKTFLTDVECESLVSSGSTGDLTLKNVAAAGKFTIERSTGDVRFENSDAEEIIVKTSTGSVTGSLRSEKVFTTKTTTGKVSVPDSDAGGKCEITTTTGKIAIEIE